MPLFAAMSTEQEVMEKLLYEATALKVAHSVLPLMVPQLKGFVAVRDSKMKNPFLHYGLVTGKDLIEIYGPSL